MLQAAIAVADEWLVGHILRQKPDTLKWRQSRNFSVILIFLSLNLFIFFHFQLQFQLFFLFFS